MPRLKVGTRAGVDTGVSKGLALPWGERVGYFTDKKRVCFELGFGPAVTGTPWSNRREKNTGRKEKGL